MNSESIISLCQYINVGYVPEEWAKYYNEALSHFDKNWLCRDFKEMFNFYGFDEQFKKRFREEIDVLNRDIKLNILVYLWYFILYRIEDKYIIPCWKNGDYLFKNNGSYMMMVVSLLMGYDIHKKIMIDKKYDEEQIKCHKENIKLTCTSDKNRLGIDGIRFSQMIWGSRFVKGHIIQVGTLEYELKTIFYNNENVIFIHIPRNASFNQEQLQYTFTNAKKYVEKYLTSKDYKYITESWLLSPELEDILKPDSRIREFRKYFTVLETKENIADFLNFVFNKPFIKDYKNLPENTSLQKSLKEKLLTKEKLHVGLGILK